MKTEWVQNEDSAFQWKPETILAFISWNFGRKQSAPSLQEEFAECYNEWLHQKEGTVENLYFRFGYELALWEVTTMIRYLQSLNHPNPNQDHDTHTFRLDNDALCLLEGKDVRHHESPLNRCEGDIMYIPCRRPPRQCERV